MTLTSERLSRNAERAKPYGRSSSVATDGMRLAQKRSHLETLAGHGTVESPSVEADALFGDFVDTGESTPMYDDLIAAQIEPTTDRAEAAIDRVDTHVTDAQAEAMQEFALGTDIAKAHLEALREYRRRDLSDYTDHISSLADAEADGTLEGSLYTAKLRNEHLRADAQEFYDARKQAALDLGKVAVVFAIGVGSLAYKAVDDKMFEAQYKFAEKRHEKRQRKQERRAEKAEAKAEKKQARKDRRAERRENLYGATVGQARAMGKFAMDRMESAYQVGLEAIDPAAATTRVASKRSAERAKSESYRGRNVAYELGHVDMSLQGATVNELLQDTVVEPFEVVESDDAHDLLSDSFTSVAMPGKEFSVLYSRTEDGQLFPQLMMHDDETGWSKARGLWHEAYSEPDMLDKRLIKAADSLLDRTGRSPLTELDVASFTKLIDALDQRKKAPAEVVSKHRLKREALKKRRDEDAAKKASESAS